MKRECTYRLTKKKRDGTYQNLTFYKEKTKPLYIFQQDCFLRFYYLP